MVPGAHRDVGIEKVDRVVVRTVRSRHREQPDDDSASRARSWGVLSGSGEAWLRLAAAILGGALLYLSSPPRDLWWLAIVGFAVFAAAVRGRRARAGFGYGVVLGLTYLLPLLGWLLDFLGAQFGPWPWLGVCAVEALFFGLAGAGMARVSRLPAAPVWSAAVFLAAELLRSSVPFGGFPWGRLAFTQPGGMLLPLAALGGAGLVTFAVALLGTGLAELVPRLRRPGRAVIPPAIVLVVPVVAALAMAPTVSTAATAGTARVAVVQGDAPNVGLGLLYEDEVLHDNHIAAAERLVADVRAGRVAKPDFVVLPEQVGSWGPARRDPGLSRIASELGVPLIVGGLATSEDGQLSNRVIRWDPRGGATEEYVKQHLVPFSEKIPLRSLAGAVSPFVARFEQDMVAADRPGVLRAGPARLGVGICFDVAYGDVFREATRAGATALAVPTNNAWFGHSEMSYQQLAMSRLRAVEHSRSMIVSATSGVSSVVRPDGSVARQTDLYTSRTLVQRVPLRTELTAATHLGMIPTWIVTAAGLLAVVVTIPAVNRVLPTKRRRRRSTGATDA